MMFRIEKIWNSFSLICFPNNAKIHFSRGNKKEVNTEIDQASKPPNWNGFKTFPKQLVSPHYL